MFSAGYNQDVIAGWAAAVTVTVTVTNNATNMSNISIVAPRSDRRGPTRLAASRHRRRDGGQ